MKAPILNSLFAILLASAFVPLFPQIARAEGDIVIQPEQPDSSHFDLICTTNYYEAKGTFADGSPLPQVPVGNVGRYSFNLNTMEYSYGVRPNGINDVTNDKIIVRRGDYIGQSLDGKNFSRTHWVIDRATWDSTRKTEIFTSKTGETQTGYIIINDSCKQAPFSGFPDHK